MSHEIQGTNINELRQRKEEGGSAFITETTKTNFPMGISALAPKNPTNYNGDISSLSQDNHLGDKDKSVQCSSYSFI